MNVLVTGAAGFLGYHVAERLLADGHTVVGLDNLNSYYDPQLKRARLVRLQAKQRFEFQLLNLLDRHSLEALCCRETFDLVIHLAAQAGVRYSVENPQAYIDANVTGFLSILEGCRKGKVPHLLYASSSSVYGESAQTPFSVLDAADRPASLYAATKRANELMAHCYTHIHGIPTTGLRFFTAYGPWGRPDMAPYRFAQAILAGEPIDLYNYGRMERDFTYVDDIVEALMRVAAQPPGGYRLFNIGKGAPVSLVEFVRELELALGRPALRRFLPLQAGDVISTCADVEELVQFTGYRPCTPLHDGIQKFAAWFLEYTRGPLSARQALASAS